MRVLVTGGHGFIGAHVVSALKARGHDVTAPHHGECDLLDIKARSRLVRDNRADVLVHLAWQTKHGEFWTAPDNTEWRNATMDVTNRFFDAGGTRAVMAGSCAEYDWTTSLEVLPEDAPCVPNTLYGRCKLETFHHCENLISQGASIAWGRLFFLMGRNETPTRFMPSIIRPLLRGEMAPMSDGKGLRDFMHAEDAGAAFAKLAMSDLISAINVASGSAVTLVDVAKKAEALVGRGELGVGLLPTRADEPASLIADVTRLSAELGFTPKHTLDSAVADCIAYWRKNGLRSN